MRKSFHNLIAVTTVSTIGELICVSAAPVCVLENANVVLKMRMTLWEYNLIRLATLLKILLEHEINKRNTTRNCKS